MDPNHDDDHPSATTNSLPLMEDDDDDDDDDDDFGVMYAIPPPLFNSNNLEPNRKLKKGVLVTVEVTTPPNTANTTHEAEIYNIIPEEEAICRFCFHRLFPVDNNNNNVMKTKCGCPFTLTHENCLIERKGNNNNNNTCDVCDQDVIYIPVILSRASSINTKTKVVNKGSSSSSSTLKKWSYFKKGRLCSYAI